MSLRIKLLFAGLPLALALVFTGVFSMFHVDALGATSGSILHDNYRSVLAAQQMSEALERMDRAAILRVLPADEDATAIAQQSRAAFADALAQQQQNLTEPGEADVSTQLAAAWHDYVTQYDAFVAAPSARAYLGELAPRFTEVKSAAAEILALNQAAMVRKSDAARASAQRARTLVLLSLLGALALGSLGSLWIAARVLQPLLELSAVARRLGAGDLSARATPTGDDEIASVGRELDEMATRLDAFHKSSLGELLRAQLAAQAAIDSIPDPVVVLGLDGKLLSSNRAAEVDLGVGVQHGDPLACIEPPLRAAIAHVRDHVLGGNGPYVPRGFEEVVALATDEGERAYLPRASPLVGHEGDVIGVSVIVQDVTRLRRFDQLRNDMIATVAHEFRTPLTSLRMAIHLVIEGAAGEPTAKQLELLSAGRDDCERLQSIVDDLLDIAKLQAGKVELDREPVRAAALIERTLDAHRADADRQQITFEIHVTPGLDDVLVDRSRVQLVFDNLVHNALRHAPPASAISLRAEPHGDAVRFTVEDRGPGIPEELQSRVFDRFFRVPGTQASGAGLGLSIAREIVEAHGGRIGVSGAAGRGAAFWFTIPTRVPAADDAPRS
ncbi:MAG TPA: ATP-binding protein [Nannocystaceae bacterium]|nr:ATP-binding protein [Nannocystaceae bacterium]